MKSHYYNMMNLMLNENPKLYEPTNDGRSTWGQLIKYNESMREIKFRGWCFKNERWEYGFYVCDVLYPDSRTSHRISPNNWEVDENSIGQFTGLKDKNGKEIYEGDVVKAHETIGVIEWTNELALFTIKIKMDDGEDADITIYSHQEEGRNTKREVIGNIYENPELLKQ